jgi:hypothetical protein
LNLFSHNKSSFHDDGLQNCRACRA